MATIYELSARMKEEGYNYAFYTMTAQPFVTPFWEQSPTPYLIPDGYLGTKLSRPLTERAPGQWQPLMLQELTIGDKPIEFTGLMFAKIKVEELITDREISERSEFYCKPYANQSEIPAAFEELRDRKHFYWNRIQEQTDAKGLIYVNNIPYFSVSGIYVWDVSCMSDIVCFKKEKESFLYTQTKFAFGPSYRCLKPRNQFYESMQEFMRDLLYHTIIMLSLAMGLKFLQRMLGW